jgi:hypothetical protein
MEESAKTLCVLRANAYDTAMKTCFYNAQDCARGLSVAYHLEGEELKAVMNLWLEHNEHGKPFDAWYVVRDTCYENKTGKKWY